MHSFSSKTVSILTAAGWNEGRRIEVFPYVRQLEQDGFAVFPVVTMFLERFGGLVLHRPNPVVPSITSSLDFGVDQTLRNFKQWESEVFSEKLHVTLCPVGHNTDAIVFAMDVEGKVYGLYDTIALFIGESGEQAIENYCSWSPSNPFQVILDLRNES